MKTCPESPALDLSGIAPAPIEAAAGSANLPVAREAAPPPAATGDERVYTLDDFRWVPVLRKPRGDGWTPQRQVDFIAALADIGCVDEAAREVGMSARSCYRLRRAPGAESFAAAWDAAVAQAARRLVDLAFDRAIHGTNEPVFDKEGNRVGRRMRQNDRLLMFLLRAYMPDRFRHAHGDARGASEPAMPEALPVAEALRTLEPPPPAEPHRLMPPEELTDALDCAVMLDGELPHWHRYRRDDAAAQASSLGEAFERQLEEAKRAAAPHSWRRRNEANKPSAGRRNKPILD